MVIAAVATLASLTLLPAPSPSPAPHPKPSPPAVRRPAVAIAPGDLYAARAKRRLASYLRLKLLELREEGLERAAGVIEGRLGIDALLTPP